MIKDVSLAEEIVIDAKNKVGLLADISIMLANEGINIEAILGYETDGAARFIMVTNANIKILNALRKKGYQHVKETEVLLVDLENKPGALKVVTTEMANKGIDIQYLYITSPSSGNSSKMVIQTSNNELAVAALEKYIR